MQIPSTAKKIIHSDVEAATRLKAYGVHLRSDQFESIATAKANGLFVVISTHTLKEAKLAQSLGADALTFSPIFDTPDKGTPKGVGVLETVVNSVDIRVIALGGIVSQEHIRLLQNIPKLYGFASIRYFAPQVDKIDNSRNNHKDT
jgi:thiamine-phosphate pyrophosphorylase